MKPAEIISFDEFNKIRHNFKKIVCTSGGFDPIHPGHVSCIHESKQFGDVLVVIVNGDGFLTRKKGKAFMDVKTRSAIVSYVRGVDYVIPFEAEGSDQTVCVALEMLKPHVFTKGGDRVDHTSIPEWDICKRNGIEVISGIGFKKEWSSSDFLKDWGEFWHEKKSNKN